MSDSEARNMQAVLRYFDGCNSGDIGELMSTLDPDVRHYFLPPTFPPIKGVMRDAKIREVRAYFIADIESNVELASFPYIERGYLPTND
jgi:hypothetical protein